MQLKDIIRESVLRRIQEVSRDDVLAFSQLSDDIMDGIASELSDFQEFVEIQIISEMSRGYLVKSFIDLDDYQDSANLRAFIEAIIDGEVYLVVKLLSESNHPHKHAKGSYYDGIIELVFGDDLIEELKNSDFSKNNIYNLLQNYFGTSLMHELKHAYDDWITGSRYTKSKKTSQFFKKYPNWQVDMSNAKYSNELEFLDILSQKEREKIRDYMALPHEIWARFIEAVDMLEFFVEEGGKLKMNNFDTLKGEFKAYFTYWHALDQKQTKRMLNAFYKIFTEYQQYVEDVNKIG